MVFLKILFIVALCLISFVVGKIYSIYKLYNKVYGGKISIRPLIESYNDYFDIFADYAKLGHNIIDDDLK